MNELHIFKNEEFGEVRTVMVNDEPYFVGKDVAEVLGYSNTRDALTKHVDDEDKGVAKCDTLGGKQELTIINESGLYSLILSSKLPTAKKFKRWVTSEVLPSIRKHGAYMTESTMDKVISDPDFGIRLLTELKAEREKLKQKDRELQIKDQLIGELKPKADYTDSILKNPGLVNINQIAKDYGMSARAINKLLAEKGVQYKQGEQWLLYKKYQDKGYTSSETINITRSNGMPDVVMRTKWTQKGRLFIYDLLKKDGICPLIEKEYGVQAM